MFPVYCRITGGSKPFQSHHLLYFPILPPISNEDAQRICRITGKAFNLTKHSYVPAQLGPKKNGGSKTPAPSPTPPQTTTTVIKNKRGSHKSTEKKTAATAAVVDSSKNPNPNSSPSASNQNNSPSAPPPSKVQPSNKLLENEAVLTCIINITGKNTPVSPAPPEIIPVIQKESPAGAATSFSIAEAKTDLLVGSRAVRSGSIQKLPLPSQNSFKRDELSTPILQNMEDIEKFREQLLSEPDLESGKWICNEWIPGQYVETVEFGRKFIPGEFIKTKYNELKFVPARVRINEFNQVEYRPGEVFETPEGELYYIAQDLKVSNEDEGGRGGGDEGPTKLEFTLQCFDNDGLSDAGSDKTGKTTDDDEPIPVTTLKPKNPPKLHREESIILQYEFNNANNAQSGSSGSVEDSNNRKTTFSEESTSQELIEEKIKSTEDLLKETIELAIRMNKVNIANELEQIASCSITEIIKDEEIIEILNQLKQLDKSTLIGEARSEGKSCRVRKHNLMSYNYEGDSASEAEDHSHSHSTQEIGKGSKPSDRLVEITEITTPDIDELSTSSKKFRLDFDDVLSGAEPMLDNSLAMHKISIRPKKTRQITTSITTIGSDDETAMDATTKQIVKEATLNELIETEEEFVKDLKYIMKNYYDSLLVDSNLSTSSSELAEARELIFGNLKQIYEFHDGVLLEGLKYYSKEPKMIGRTFIRLERDFDKHVAYCRDEPAAQEFLKDNPELLDFFEERRASLNDEKTILEHLKLPIQRLNDYQVLLGDLLHCCEGGSKSETSDLNRALELITAIPQKTTDLKFLNSIEGYPNIHSLGRLIKHDWFACSEESESGVAVGKKSERYLFLFKSKILVTKVKRISDQRSIFILKDILKLPELKIAEERSDSGKKQLKISTGRKSYILEKDEGAVSQDAFKQSAELWLNEVSKLQAVLSKDDTSLSQGKDRSFEEATTTDTEETVSYKGDFKRQKSFQRGDSEDIKTDPLEPKKPAQTNDHESILKTTSHTSSVETEKNFEPATKTTEKLLSRTSSIDTEVKTKEKLSHTSSIDTEVKTKEKLTSRTSSSIDKNLETSESSTRKVTNIEVCEVKPIKLIDGDTLAKGAKAVSADRSIPTTSDKKSTSASSNTGEEKVQQPVTVSKTDEQKRLDTITESKPIESFAPAPTSAAEPESVKVGKSIERDSTTRKSIKKEKSIEGDQKGSKMDPSSSDIKLFGRRKSSSGNIILVRRDSDNTNPRPQLIDALKSTECEPGDSANFVTKINSKSPCSVTWLKDNRPLEDRLADRFKISQNGSTYKLNILNCLVEDSGLYTVKAVNEFGNSVTSSAQLLVHVLSKEERQKRAEDNSPFFNVKFQDTQLLLDTTVCLMVDVKGDPVPSIKFFKDGAPLKFDDRVQLEKNSDHSYDLKIHAIGEDDAGVYKCVASNSFGKSEFESHVTTTSEKDVFKSLEGKRLLEPGEEPDFNWYRDGKIFEPEERFKVMFKDEEDTLALVFQHVTPEDAGLYTCVASTSSGKISCSAELTVLGAVHQLLKEPAPPTLVSGLTDTEAGIGSTAMFELAVTGFPKPTIAWIKDGKEINTAEAKYKILHEDDDSTTLLIKGVSTADAGSYRALITNDLGEISSQANLVVKSPPFFKTKMKETVYGLEGQPLKINCDVDGNPKPTIIWYKDGIEQKPSATLKFVDNNVIIDKLSMKEHSGNWSILATNSQGQMSQFFNLVVNRPPKIIKHLEEKVIKSTTETVEYTVTIEECMTESGDKIIWTKDGVELRSDKTTGIIIEKGSSSNEYKLKMNKLKRDDSSRISFEVSNEYGKDFSTSDLLINREPVITKKLASVNIKDSGEASFDIKVDAFPKPKVRWFLDGIEIDSKRYQHDEDAGTYKLKLPEADVSGKIIVKAENEFGRAEDSAELNVLCKPSFLKGLQDVRIVQDTQLDLKVVVKGNPSPTISWFHNGNEVSADARVKITKESTETYHCTFNVVLPSDNGEWEVKAKNEFGESSSKCIVTVEGKPIFEKKLKDVIEVVETETLQVDVAVAGEPKPVIKWFLNSTELTRSECTTITVNDIKSIVESQLVIKNIKVDEESLEDQILSCRASNKYGESETSAKLKIISLSDLKRPKIVGPLQNLVLKKGENAVLKLAIKGNPTSVQWFLNGKEVKGGTVDKDGNYCLPISNASDLNDGEYSVIAKNEFGEDASKATITVNFLPEIIGLKDICIVPGDCGEFKAEIKCKPKLQSVQWFNPNGTEIKEGTEDADGVYKLKLEPKDKSAEGTYQLKAKNALGESQASAKLKMQMEPPSFSKGLIDYQMREKESLELKVRYQGLPHPSIAWKLNGEIIETGSGVIIQTDGLTSSLTIENMNKSQFGKYEVVATNMGGDAVTTGQVKLEQVRPHFIKGLPRKQELPTGADLILEIKVDGSPIPHIAWLKDGIEIGPENLSKDGTVLTISNVQEKDRGVYSVIIKNDNGEEKSNCSVEIIKKKSKPELITPLGDVLNLREGQPIVLESVVRGYPEPVVKWFKDGKPIKNPLISTTVKPGEGDLQKIGLSNNSVKKEDAGIYSIQVSNEKGTLEDSIMVNVQDALVKPKFIKTPEPEISTMPNFPILLDYKVFSNPKPELALLFNGKEIDLKPEGIIEVKPNEYSVTYAIENPTAQSQGAYLLCVKNTEGSASSPETNISLGSAFIADEEETEPILLTPLKSQEVNEGTDLLLKVKLSGNPVPNIKWSFNGEEIKKGVLFDGTWSSLTIKDCNPDLHSGLYECEISNKCGEDSTQGDVKVLKFFEKPSFLDKFEDTEQLPTKDCKMSARIGGNPFPEISWFKDGVKIGESTKHKFTSDPISRMITLSVRNCTDVDIGNYSCVIKNRLGEDKCQAKLDVKKFIKLEKEEPPNFLKKITDTDLYEGMVGKFTACIGGNPIPTYEWYKGSVKLSEGDSSKYKFEADGLLLRLIIKNVNQDDIGEYRLRIRNKLGELSCSAKLSCEGSFSKKSTDTLTRPAAISNHPLPLLERPIISSMTDRYLTLSWKPSLQMGDFRHPITYQVEMTEGGVDEDKDNWFTIHRQLKHNICDIRNLKPGVDYKFRVRVENKYGVSAPSPFAFTLRSKIYVPSQPSYGTKFKDFKYEGPQHEPIFLNQIDEQYGIRGIGTQVIWYLYGCPTPEVKFLFNGLPCHQQFTYSGSGELILFINKMISDDVGRYEAIAWNEHGEARRSVELLMAEHPRFINRLDEKWIMLRDGAKLTATVSGIPKPTIKWFKDWHLIGDSSRMKLEEIDNGDGTWNVSLQLDNSILKDEGLYSISASNVAGGVSTSATLHISDDEELFNWKTYNQRASLRNRDKRLSHFNYLIGEELGRGTQGIVHHVTDRNTGESYACKSMKTNDPVFLNWMKNELSILRGLNHRNISRLVDVYQNEDSTEMKLVQEYFGGGELLQIMKRDRTEYDISKIIRETLLGLKYLHDSNIAHLSLTPRDILFSHAGNEYYVKLIDFGLSRIIDKSKSYEPLDFGQPEYVAPEIVNHEGVGLEADMWSLGLITSLLLTGRNFYQGINDMETLTRIKTIDWSLDESFSYLSHEARDFLSRLIVRDPKRRMTVDEALRHEFLSFREESKTEIRNRNSDYIADFMGWYSNASCRELYRRRPLEGAFTHSSRMVYPPYDDVNRKLHERNINDSNLNRPNLEYELGTISSESRYQQGPDTYLLQLRDADFPARLRRYMKVAASRSPSMAMHMKASAIDTTHTVIRERRRFTDIMDEEVDDERKDRISNYGHGPLNSEPRRLRHEVGPDTSHYANESLTQGKEGTMPFLREKPDAALEYNLNEKLDVKVIASGDPEPIIQWFKNDLVMSDTSRVKIVTEEGGRSSLQFGRLLVYDTGLYKVVARNKNGSTTARFKLFIGDGHRPTPEVQLSNLDYSIESNPIEMSAGEPSETLEKSFPDLETILRGNYSYLALSKQRNKMIQIVHKDVMDCNTDLIKTLVNVNISNLVSYFEVGPTLIYIKEYCGDLLLNYLSEQDFYTEETLCNVSGQVMDALNYVHWRGWILTNLNPGNVVFDGHHAKLVDFTCAQPINTSRVSGRQPQSLLEYQAPEQISSDSDLTVVPQTDVWAFGVLLYICLSGVSPFKGANTDETKQNIQFVRFRFEYLFKEISQEATKLFIQLFKRSPLKRPNIEECFDTRWFSPSEFMQKRREKACFQGQYLKEYVDECRRNEVTSEVIEKTIRTILK